jgi:hypothetical protein
MAAPAQAGNRPLALSIWIPLAVVTAPLGIALLVELVLDLGRVDPTFFELCAQIIPVLALPLFLERGGILIRRIEREGLTPELRAITAGHAILTTGSLLVGEAGALTAVATGRTTTFLTVVCVISMLIQLALLAFTTASRIMQEGRDRHSKK